MYAFAFIIIFAYLQENQYFAHLRLRFAQEKIKKLLINWNINLQIVIDPSLEE